MKLFSDCSGKCCVCSAGGHGCLAGHGDDDFSPATKEHIINNLDNNYFEWDRQYMIDYLREKYDYIYDG